jgi:hypothetical protein
MNEAQIATLVQKIAEAMRTGEIPSAPSFTEEEMRTLRYALPLFETETNRAAIARTLPLLDTQRKAEALALTARFVEVAMVLGSVLRFLKGWPGALLALLVVAIISGMTRAEILQWLKALLG